MYQLLISEFPMDAFVQISVVFFPDLYYNLIARKDKSVFISVVVDVVVVVVVVV